MIWGGEFIPDPPETLAVQERFEEPNAIKTLRGDSVAKQFPLISSLDELHLLLISLKI